MIILWILAVIALAFVFAILVVAANGATKREARKIIQQGYVTDLKQAKRTLKMLGDRSLNNNREAEELYDGLKNLVERAKV